MSALTEKEQATLERFVADFIDNSAHHDMDAEQFRSQVSLRIKFLAKKGFRLTGIECQSDRFTMTLSSDATGYSMRAIRVGSQYGSWQYEGAKGGIGPWFAANTPRELFAQMKEDMGCRVLTVTYERHNREYLTKWEGRGPDAPLTRVVITDPVSQDAAIVCVKCNNRNVVQTAVEVLTAHGWDVTGWSAAAKVVIVEQDFSVPLSYRLDQLRNLTA